MAHLMSLLSLFVKSRVFVFKGMPAL